VNGLPSTNSDTHTTGCQSWAVDTCCNDSNGSSNSRNTNTLVDPIPIILPESEQGPPELVCQSVLLQQQHSKLNRRISLDEVPRFKQHNQRRRIISGEFTDELDPNGNGTNYFSDIGSYTTSFSGPYPIRTSTPIEIKKASTRRVTVNYPKKSSAHQHYKKTKETNESNNARCLCQLERACPVPTARDSGITSGTDYHLYDKLIEDSYGILICEGETTGNKNSHRHHHHQSLSLATRGINPQQMHTKLHPKSVVLPSIFHASKKLKVLCAKCLQNHDPLLSNCGIQEIQIPVETLHNSNRANFHEFDEKSKPMLIVGASSVGSLTTDYPSDTENTWTMHGDEEDQEEYPESSNLSTATYTTWPRQVDNPYSMWATSTHLVPPTKFSKEFTSLEYVKTWLLASQPRRSHQEIKRGNIHNNSGSINTDSGGCGSAGTSNLQHSHTANRFRTMVVSQSPCDKIKRKVRRSKTLQGEGRKRAETVISNVVMRQPPPKQKQHPALLLRPMAESEKSEQTGDKGICEGTSSSGSSSIGSNKCRKKRQRLADDNDFDDIYNDIETIV